MSGGNGSSLGPGGMSGMSGGDMGGMEGQAEGSMVVCIADQGDGTFSVYVDGDQDGGDSGDGPQQAENIDDALSIARQMLQSEASEGASMGMPGADDAAPLDAGQAKAAWRQMAAKRSKGTVRTAG